VVRAQVRFDFVEAFDGKTQRLRVSFDAFWVRRLVEAEGFQSLWATDNVGVLPRDLGKALLPDPLGAIGDLVELLPEPNRSRPRQSRKCSPAPPRAPDRRTGSGRSPHQCRRRAPAAPTRYRSRDSSFDLRCCSPRNSRGRCGPSQTAASEGLEEKPGRVR
jgi:hypothetical protein